MDFKSIKLVGVDLDGTFLRDDKTISPSAGKITEQLYNRGILLVPITGRPLNGVPQCIRDIPQIEYIICSNGAQLIDLKSGKSLCSYTISNKKSNEIIRLLQNTDCFFEAFADGVGYVEPMVYKYYEEAYKNTVLWDYIYTSRQLVDSVAALFDGTGRCADEFFITCKSNEVRNKLKAELTESGGIQLCELGDCFIEITRIGTDKGNALAALCDMLKIDVKDTIAFGDGENDMQLMQRAGIAVAMHNAHICIKQKADIIAKSNNDDGVVEILEKILI